MILGQAKRLHELKELKGKQLNNRTDTQVITIASGKGGTGKSFLTVNLADTLSKMGYFTLVIDLDTNLSNVNLMLNSYHNRSLADFLDYDCGVDELIHKISDSFHVIMGESGRIDHPEINSGNLGHLFRELKTLPYPYDYILIDTSSGIGKDLFTVLNFSHQVILVSTPEPTSIMDAYVVLKMLNAKKIDLIKKVIINKVDSAESGQTAFENLKKVSLHFLKNDINLLGIITNRNEVSLAIQAQKLIGVLYKDSIINKQLMKIAENLPKNVQLLNNDQKLKSAGEKVL